MVQAQRENLGPAERIIQTVLAYSDHMVHNRPGMVSPDANSVTGSKWMFVTHKTENDVTTVYERVRQGKKETLRPLGVKRADGSVVSPTGAVVGQYRPAGVYPEVATWIYRQVSEVWKLDNEFAARWASYAFTQDHRDLKVVLAAFMLCQSRKGDPVMENGKLSFNDSDFREIGESMILTHTKDKKGFDPKLLLRVRAVLVLPGVAEINRELGFGQSMREPHLGRWAKTVRRYLKFREDNLKVLQAMVKGGYRTSLIELAKHTGYKPENPRFFEILRWKQVQAKDGRRAQNIGKEVIAAETWAGLDERAICQRIMKEKPGYKRLTSLVPSEIGITRAIMAAAIEAGALSDKELVILTPTIEELGLMKVQDVRERWERAAKAADDMRAANIARNVKSKDTREKLQDAADTAVKKAVEEVARGLMTYVLVDISGSMQGAIVRAKEYVAKFLQAFPVDKIRIAVFNSSGREVRLPHASAAGVEHAFAGINAGGATDYGAGVRAIQKYKPAEGEDAWFFIVGDEQAQPFTQAVRDSGLNPMAFGFLKVTALGPGGTFGARFDDGYVAVRETAAQLGVPCFMVDEKTFADPYAIPRTIRGLIAATPVGVQKAAPVPRVTLVDTILQTELLKRPAWAA